MKLLITMEIITPMKFLKYVQVSSFHCNTVKGEMMIYPEHANILAKLDMGIVKLVSAGKEISFMNYEGILHFSQTKGKAIVESILFREEIDLKRLDQQRQELKQLENIKNPTIHDSRRYYHNSRKIKYLDRLLK